MESEVKGLVECLRWHGHDSFHIDATPDIWFDPWKLRGRFDPADIILVSHDHFDHCSPDDVARLRGPRTVVLAEPAAAAKLGQARAVRPGEAVTVRGVTIHAVPAYNVNKFRAPGKLFHPREAGHLGWIVEFENVRVYFAGDTDFIPEMRGMRCDVALLPVSGTYVMTVDEAIQAARAIGPRAVVPMHYGDIVGNEADGALFAAGWEGQTFVLKPERAPGD